MVITQYATGRKRDDVMDWLSWRPFSASLMVHCTVGASWKMKKRFVFWTYHNKHVKELLQTLFFTANIGLSRSISTFTLWRASIAVPFTFRNLSPKGPGGVFLDAVWLTAKRAVENQQLLTVRAQRYMCSCEQGVWLPSQPDQRDELNRGSGIRVRPSHSQQRVGAVQMLKVNGQLESVTLWWCRHMCTVAE